MRSRRTWFRNDGRRRPSPAHLGGGRDAPRQLVDGPIRDDPAVREDDDPIRQLLRLVEVVGGEEDRRLLGVGEAAHQVVEVASRLRVEAGGRLVEEEELGSTDETDRDVEPPSLPA